MSTEKAVTTAALKAVLKVGAANGQDVKTLALLADTTERAVRTLVPELRKEGVPVCAHPKTGYFIAETLEEVDAVANWLHSRGVHSIVEAKNLRAAFIGGENVDFDQLEQSGAFEL